MGRAIVVLIIAGIAGLMGWFALQPECRTAVTTQEACVALPGFSASSCDTAFIEARRKATLYTTLIACQNDGHETCDLHTSLTGFTPRPERFCVAQADGSTIVTPIYRKRGQALR
jgi:hypothetical protein